MARPWAGVACGCFALTALFVLQLAEATRMARTPRSLRSAGDVCNADSPAFSASRCHELALGVTDPRDLLVPGKDPTFFQVLKGNATCGKTFHALSVDEAERLQPQLSRCLVSTWAAKMYSSLAADPCSQDSAEKADMVVLPGYTAVECNWPIFGGGVCMNTRDGLSNFARAGSACRGEDTLQAYRELQAHFGKHVVVLENSPNPRGNKYDLPDSSLYADPEMSWAFVGADSSHYRPGSDVSLPPGPSLRCQMSPQLAQSFEEPLEKKAFLATFKGSFESHPFRRQAQMELHDGQKVIIDDKHDDRWRFEELLYSTVFALILRGDDIMTTRVNEAICSGGIPVLVTDSWIPPFNETVPWESFGLIHDETDLGSLTSRLENLSKGDRMRLRQGAREACENNFQTIDRHAASLAQAVTRSPKQMQVTK